MPTDKKVDCLILKFFGMINEQEMLDLFQVEELEKRYEMGWIKKTEVSTTCDSAGKCSVTVKATL
jgi:hypothetical protein